MPLLTPIQSEVIWSLIAITYGVMVERHYVAYSTSLANLAGFLMVLASVDLPSSFALLLLVYAVTGGLAARARSYTLMNLLGCKPYGSLTLAIGLYETGFLVGLQDLGIFPDWLGAEGGAILVAWLLLASGSHLAMMLLVRREKKRKPM